MAPPQTSPKNKAVMGEPSGKPGAQDSETHMEALKELEAELIALQLAYEQHFLGNDRRAPLRKHQDFKRRLVQLKNQFIRQTAVRFRLDTLTQKLTTLERLWERTMREIEEGTYRRDLFKAKLHAERRKKAHPEANGDAVAPAGADESGAFNIDEDLDLSDLDEDIAEAAGSLDAAISAVAAAPLIPPIKPLVPSIAAVGTTPPPAAGLPVITPAGPRTGLTPALRPPGSTPAGGLPRPDLGVTARPPGATPAEGLPRPALSPPYPGSTGVTAALRPPGSTPVPGSTGVTAALRPPGSTPVPGSTGVTAALRPPGSTPAPGSTGVTAALRPPGSTPAPGSTGVTAALRPPGSTPAGGLPRPALSPPSQPAPAARPAPIDAGGLSEGKIKAIYDAYVLAKRRCGEDTSSLTLNSVASTLKAQVPTLLKQHNAKSVEFKVVIKDGRAVLRAQPKE